MIQRLLILIALSGFAHGANLDQIEQDFNEQLMEAYRPTLEAYEEQVTSTMEKIIASGGGERTKLLRGELALIRKILESDSQTAIRLIETSLSGNSFHELLKRPSFKREEEKAPSEPIVVTAADAKRQGPELDFDEAGNFLSGWVDSSASWPLPSMQPGSWRATFEYALDSNLGGGTISSSLLAGVKGKEIQSVIIKLDEPAATEGWDDFDSRLNIDFKILDSIANPILVIRGVSANGGEIFRLRSITLTPTPPDAKE